MQVEEEGQAVQVQVREDASIMAVIVRTSDQVGLAVTAHSTLFEISEHLNMGKITTMVYV